VIVVYLLLRGSYGRLRNADVAMACFFAVAILGRLAAKPWQVFWVVIFRFPAIWER